MFDFPISRKFLFMQKQAKQVKVRKCPGGGGGVIPYMGYKGMCGLKGYGFSAVLVINRVSIIAILPPLW